MQIPSLPAEVRYTLREHRESENETIEVDGQPVVRVKLLAPNPDAPVFVFPPLPTREQVQWARKINAAEKSVGDATEVYLDLFAEKVSVENLRIGDHPCTREDAVQLDLKWQLEVALQVYTYSRLSDEELGKSS